ncbi:glycosyltransferase [Paenibacillus sp. 481]|uniref:glycosyltransferase n=1 Tax=Paenibacillus sp. 481 TaxID=2835869 RepID=UPI001E418AAD|nr:glycosyltransferase family 2 protein [Paenibacillus sp. 481]UHA71813.1 glycosyltransferase family 2 protein [Paenibacillus sp. 481]
MTIVYGVLAVLSVVLWTCIALPLTFQLRKISYLRDISYPLPVQSGVALPKLRVIIAARNEQKAIERCVDSLMAQTYSHLEVTVVNDRSTDETLPLLEQMQQKYPRLHVISIQELPEGWLGKNHALYVGSMQTDGDWILFSDADSLYHPQALEQAIRYGEHHQLDHLAAIPEFGGTHLWSKVYGAYVMMVGGSFGQIWKVRERGSKQHIGIGAFNMIKRSAYEDIGTHEAIALCTLDDVMLGKVVKEKGFMSDVVFGRDRVVVWNWYETLGQLIRSVEKTAFTWGRTISTSLFSLLMIYPFIGIGFGTSVTRAMCGVAAVSIMLMYANNSRFLKSGFWFGLLHPLLHVFLIFGSLRGIYNTTKNGGMTWRGTVYKEKNLKV